MANEKVYQLPQFLAELTKNLKEKVEEFSEKCKEIRKAELKKSETCPLCGNFDNPDICNCIKKSSKLEKVSPPGMKELPEKLKEEGHSPASAFKIAWAAYKKKHGGKKSPKTKKNSMDPSSEASAAPGMMMSEKNHDLKDFPSIGDEEQGYHDVSTQVGAKPKAPAAAFEPTAVGKKSKLPPTAKSMKKKEPLKRTEDYIDGRNDNDHKKRLKTFGGKNTKMPDDKSPGDYGKTGSGGEIKPLTKESMSPGMKAPKAPGMASPKLPKIAKRTQSLNDLHDAKVKSKLPTPAPTHPTKEFKSRVSATVDRIASGISGKKATGRMDMGAAPTKAPPKHNPDLPFGGKEFSLKPATAKSEMAKGFSMNPGVKITAEKKSSGKPYLEVSHLDEKSKKPMKKAEASFGSGDGNITMSPMRFSEDTCLVCSKKNSICKCK